VPVPGCFSHYGCIVKIEVWYCDNSSIAISLRIAFHIPGLLFLHMSFRVGFSISKMNILAI
jgi:hypothetical protein